MYFFFLQIFAYYLLIYYIKFFSVRIPNINIWHNYGFMKGDDKNRKNTWVQKSIGRIMFSICMDLNEGVKLY
jgi:hypothetical protein